MKLIKLAIVVLAMAGAAIAQGHYYNNNGTVVDPTGRPVSYPTVRVCTEPASGTPCSPVATGLYSDFGLTQPLSTPFQGDAYGNVSFYSAAVTTSFHLQISGQGIQTFDIPYVFLGSAGSAVLFSSPPPLGNVTANSVFANPLNVTAGSGGDTNFNSIQTNVLTTGEVDTNFLRLNGTTNYGMSSFYPWYQAFYQPQGWDNVRTPTSFFGLYDGLPLYGRLNTFQQADPGTGTGNYYSCSMSHTGAGGSGSGYKLRFVDANSGYSLPGPICFDPQGYTFGQLGGGNNNVVTYNQPGFYTQVIMARCTGTTESTCNATGSVVIDPNHVAEGVLSSITACLTKTSCTWTDDGSWANGTLQSLAGPYTANPDDNTTSSANFGGRVFMQRGAQASGGLSVIGYSTVFTNAGNIVTPTVSAKTTGATTYNYYTVLHTYGSNNNSNGTYTVQGPFTVSNGNSTVDNLISMYCTPFWNSWDLLRGDNGHYVALNLPCQSNWTQPGNPQPYVYEDTTGNISGNTYVPPTRDSTGDFNVFGNIVGGAAISSTFLIATNNVSAPLVFGCALSGTACDSTKGFVALNGGDATHDGFVGWNNNAGTRVWHMGFDAGTSPNLSVIPDSGAAFNVDSPLWINGTILSDINRNLTTSTITGTSLTSTTANPATAGFIAMAKSDFVEWRNNSNSGNLALGVALSDGLAYNAHTFISSAGNLDAGTLAATTGVAPSAALGGSGAANTVLLFGTPDVWGTVPNAALTNSSTTVNGAVCTLGSTCNVIPGTPTAGWLACYVSATTFGHCTTAPSGTPPTCGCSAN